MEQLPTTESFRLDDMVIVVTGAARGLGYTLASSLGRFGAKLALLDLDQHGLSAAVKELSSAGISAIGIPCNVTDPTQVTTAVSEIHRTFERIDGLLNNAGINRIGPSESMKPEDWFRVIEVNLYGAFLMSQSVGKHMIKQKKGSIINMASIHAHVGPALHPASAYSASKSGLVGLTRALASEWGVSGVRVNAIAPGFIHTEMTANRLDDSEYMEAILARSPLKAVGKPADLTGAIVYLFSNMSRMVTGQSLAVDAGWLAI